MKTIEEKLKERQEDLNQLEVPEELELRLRSALIKTKTQRHIGWRIRFAVACLALFIISYNFDTFA